LETVLTHSITGKGASSVSRQIKEETSSTIKLEDLAKLMSHVQPSFKDLDLLEDDPVIVVDDSDEDEDDEVHATENVETKDTSVPKYSSPMSSQIQELTNQVLILQSQKHKLELEKNKGEAEVALLKAQPSFPNVEQLKELLFDELIEEVKGLKKQVHELEIELPGDLKEIPTKLEDFTKTVASVQAKLKTLDALPGLLLNVTKALNKFAQVLDFASSKAGDQSVPSAGQADTRPTEGENDTNQATISQLFQKRAEKSAEKDNLNKNKLQTKTTPPPIPPVIITTITQMQSPSLQPPPKRSSQPEGEHIKKDKGKKALSSKEAEKESTDSYSDDETHVTSSMVEPSRIKKLKKFYFITEDVRHIHLTEEEINHQKKLEEDAKAEAAKQEGGVRKAELVDLLGPKVVKKYYNDKLQYDRYYDKMLNKRTESRITNCDILTRKGPITLKVYREDGTSEIILNFKASDLHLGEWREVMKACPNMIVKGWETIYKQIGTRMDYTHTTEAELANKRLKSLVQYKDHLPGTVLNELDLGMIMFNSYHRQDFVTIEDMKDFSITMLYTVQEIFFRRHQGPGLDDHARTFSSLLLAELESLKLLQRQLFRSVEDWEVSSLQCRQRLPKKWLSFCQSLRHTNHVKDFVLASLYMDFHDSPDDEEDTRSNQEYLTDLKEKYQAIALLAKSKRFFKKGPTKDFEAKYNKIKAKLALLSSSASASKASMVKNKGLIAEAYDWDEEEVSSDDNEMVEVKVLMALAEDNEAVSKEGARNGEWVKISMRSEQIPSQKKRILGIDQLNEEPSSFEQKDLVFVKFSFDDTKVSIPGVERPWLSEAKGFTLPNHDTGRILPAKSQRNHIRARATNLAVTDSSATDYDSVDESSVYSTPLPPLKKLDGAEPVFGPKTNKSILRSKSTFRAETLKDVIINEPSSALARGNKSSTALKVNSTLAGKLKSVKIEDDPPLAIVIKELNNLKLQISKNQSSYSRNNQPQQVPQNALQNKYKTQFKRGCDMCGLNNHHSKKCYKVRFCKKYERTDHRTCDHAEYLSTMNMSNHLKNQGGSSSRSRTLGPSNHCFPPCIHCRFSDHLSDDCVNYTICDICGSYDHDTYGHNMIISLRRGIKPKNPQHVMKSYETCGSTVHTTTDHNDIEWFKTGEAL
ncbi:hypothetical protein Tco_1124942, partial [Tanacetum coccineum]